MNNFKILFLLLFCLVQIFVLAQNDEQEKIKKQILSKTDTVALKKISGDFANLYGKNKEEATQLFRDKNLLVKKTDTDGRTFELQGIHNGLPVFNTTFNRVAAQTTSTSNVWGYSGFNLDGSQINLGIWDGGAVFVDHNSFREGSYGPRHAFFIDTTGTLNEHATHVAGTIIADGDNYDAKGMADKASLYSRDWNWDITEMANAAAGIDPYYPGHIILSNHSYGSNIGWTYADFRGTGTNSWYWMAYNNQTNDSRFGNYEQKSFDLDQISNNAPYYTIVWAAGNDRGEGPEAFAQHYYWDGNNWISSTSYHPKDGGVEGFTCIPPEGVSKNIITVGAVDDIYYGYQQPSDVQQIITKFSSSGPTKDGRIKPDIVANGDNLFSTLPSNGFDYKSGTSMAAPNVTGSIALLLQHYKNTHNNQIPLSSTMKAIVIHTADESGTTPGPDYKFGWGLLNTYKAAQLISQDQNKPTTIEEKDLLNGQSVTINNLYNDGTQPIKITLVWNDLPPANMIAGPILMRDLDVRLYKDGVTFYPYKLNPANPSAAATTGDNSKDNVEQIYIQSPASGYYSVVVSHKGTLSTIQKFSLITTGFIEPFVTFYLKQLGNDNQPFGQASYWDNSMWNPVPPTQPVTLSLDKHHFLSIQDFKPLTYEKFNIWEDNLSNKCYRNWDTLSLKATTTQVFSKFIPKITGVTIKNSLEGTSVNGGNITFKDPWLADVTEQPYGLRNQGMSAPFREQSSPFSPDFSSSYNGYVYKGIFLNQSGPQNDWTGTYYSVGSPTEQTIIMHGQNRKFYPFNWTGTGVTIQYPWGQETGIVFNTSDAVATATLKGQLMSKEQTGISSNSQRKMVRTDNGIYHVVYESMGSVWYTHSLTSNYFGNWSTDFWITNHAKNPSLDYEGNTVLIVCEYYDPALTTDSELWLFTFNPGSGGLYSIQNYETIITYPSSYFGNAKPVIAFTSSQIFIVYRKNASEGLKQRTKWYDTGWTSEVNIPQTDANSINPAVAGRAAHVHIVFESLAAIHYKFAYRQGSSWRYESLINLSSGSGFNQNYYPSISISDGANAYVMASWQGVYTTALDKISAKSDNIGMTRYAAVARVGYGTNWGGFSNFSNYVKYTNNNSINAVAGSILAWSENNGQVSKYVKRRANGLYDPIEPLSTNGIHPIISNGSSFENIKAMAFNTSTSAPYLLNRCNNDFNIELLQKETTKQLISYGRSGVVEKDGIEFLFNIGDVSANGNTIKFIERVDTLPVTSIEEMNSAAVTETFDLNSSSELIFSNYYYVVNKNLADSLLGENFNLTFKSELVKASDNAVVGTFDVITYDKYNLDKYANLSYLVDCAGIESGEYFMRLTTTINEDVNLYLSDIQRDDIVLEKSNLLTRNFKGEGIPVTYSLEQNFPNPFNPSTTIRYQLPQDGMVTLKVYDILGSEVATLVNEQKTSGRYEVNFDASRFASGVYIYKITSGSYVSSKKMLLVK